MLKLNLGSGQHPKPGYLNVDKHGSPDLRWDLEQVPWPWETSSVDEVVMNHVLEHLGATTELYFGVVRELYRVCAHDALVHITVPHPRHDDFLTDPTHVRAVTPAGLALFSQAANRAWARDGIAASPLGLYLEVDFEVVSTSMNLDEPWASQLRNHELDQDAIWDAVRRYNNVVKEITMVVKVIKAR